MRLSITVHSVHFLKSSYEHMPAQGIILKIFIDLPRRKCNGTPRVVPQSIALFSGQDDSKRRKPLFLTTSRYMMGGPLRTVPPSNNMDVPSKQMYIFFVTSHNARYSLFDAPFRNGYETPIQDPRLLLTHTGPVRMKLVCTKRV